MSPRDFLVGGTTIFGQGGGGALEGVTIWVVVVSRHLVVVVGFVFMAWVGSGDLHS